MAWMETPWLSVKTRPTLVETDRARDMSALPPFWLGAWEFGDHKTWQSMKDMLSMRNRISSAARRRSRETKTTSVHEFSSSGAGGIGTVSRSLCFANAFRKFRRYKKHCSYDSGIARTAFRDVWANCMGTKPSGWKGGLHDKSSTYFCKGEVSKKINRDQEKNK